MEMQDAGHLLPEDKSASPPNASRPRLPYPDHTVELALCYGAPPDLQLTEASPGKLGKCPTQSTCDTDLLARWPVREQTLQLPAFVADELLSEKRITELRATLPANIPNNCLLTLEVQRPEEADEKPLKPARRCPMRRRAVQAGLAGTSILIGVLLGHRRSKRQCK